MSSVEQIQAWAGRGRVWGTLSPQPVLRTVMSPAEAGPEFSTQHKPGPGFSHSTMTTFSCHCPGRDFSPQRACSFKASDEGHTL